MQHAYFPDRTNQLLSHLAAGLLGPERAAALIDHVASAPNIKGEDAKALLRKIAAHPDV
jgi:hypothetical protein